MTTGVVREHNMEKQMGGCMAGFFNIFDRHQTFTGKRYFATRRLPPSSAVESEPETERSSPAVSTELSEPQRSRSPPSPNWINQYRSPDIQSPAPDSTSPAGENPARTPLRLPMFELKEGAPRSPWRFSKEAPRLSLDSRSVVDAKGKLRPREIQTNPASLSGGGGYEIDEAATEVKRRRSPSVVARLMGLERLPSSDPEPTQKAELRRSASESRVSRDRLSFTGGAIIQPQNECAERNQQRCNVVEDQKNSNETKLENGRPMVRAAMDRRAMFVRTAEPARRTVQRGIVPLRRNFFDSADFFPELPSKQNASVYGGMEKKLKLRGIDEPAKDLETLKQILEALQLKGLLHPSKPQSQTGNSSFVIDTPQESPIFVLRPVDYPPAQPDRRARPDRGARRSVTEPPPSRPRSRTGGRLTAGEVSPAGSPRREQRPAVDRRTEGNRQNIYLPARSECGLGSRGQRKKSTVDMNRRLDEPPLVQRRARPVQSPKIASKRTGPVQTVPNPSPRNQKSAAKFRRQEEQLSVSEDALSTVSGNSVSTCSPTDTEHKDSNEGRNLLERCGKLLDSIAEMTATARATTGELQPSPVSVLDSSFYKETSPSPILKRSIDFNDQSVESEDEMSSPAMSSSESKSSEDYDFAYVSDIIRASNNLLGDPHVFSLLEKQQYVKGKDTSKVSRLERRLIFDTINEILHRKRNLPPWKAISSCSPRAIWSEFRKMKERDISEDLFDAICGVLRKDLAGDGVTGWGGCHLEVSEAILDIERLIFKDLISETIRYLAAFAGNYRKAIATALPRRKLVF